MCTRLSPSIFTSHPVACITVTPSMMISVELAKLMPESPPQRQYWQRLSSPTNVRIFRQLKRWRGLGCALSIGSNRFTGEESRSNDPKTSNCDIMSIVNAESAEQHSTVGEIHCAIVLNFDTS